MQRLLNGDIQKCRTDADEHQSGIVYLAISLLTHTQAFGGKGGGPKDMTQGVLGKATPEEIREEMEKQVKETEA